MSPWADLIGAGFAYAKTLSLSITRRFYWTGYTKPTEEPVPDKKTPRFPTAKDFLMQIQPYAVAIETKYGIPWLMCATQAAHESGNGNSRLTTEANNLFGVTGDGVLKAAGVPKTMGMEAVKAWLAEHPECPALIMKTNEEHPLPPEKIHYWTRPGDILTKTPHGTGSDLLVERPFHKYASWSDSIQDWAQRIIAKYPKAHLCAVAKDAPGFFNALQEGGYATDQKYAAQLKVRYSEMEALV
jgi:flagellum-specific peptidoglycan hydrolase FlgJ